MGIFTFFKQFRQRQKERTIAKNLKTIQNPKAIREERVAAIEYFKGLRDLSLAVPSLLKRFDYSLDHGIYDTREKESAMEGILGFGKDSVPYVIEHLRNSNRIAWPIKVLQKLADEPSVVNALEDCLHLTDFQFDRDKIDKNYDILCYLRDYPVPDKGEKLLGFLDALDERVRFATVEVLLAQNTDKHSKHLARFVLDTTAENTRLHQIVVDAFLERGWRLDLDLSPGTALAPGIEYSAERKLRKVRG